MLSLDALAMKFIDNTSMLTFCCHHYSILLKAKPHRVFDQISFRIKLD